MKAGSVLILFVLAGCQSPPPPVWHDLAARDVQTGSFKLHVQERLTDPQAPVTVYIEGDGPAWRDKDTPSDDPTPQKAVGLKLAMLDDAANVLYVARPCQYVKDDPLCGPRVWTEQRFATPALSALREAIDARVGPERPLHLVGYSGGATMAVALAAQRGPVLSLRTVAGNLDTKTFNAYHGVMGRTVKGSVDPIKLAPAVSDLPQAHWTGEKDNVVPPMIAKLYLGALRAPPCAMIWPTAEASHTEGWEDVWLRALADNPLDHCGQAQTALFALTPDGTE